MDTSVMRNEYMSILIVDDEMLVVESLAVGMDWRSLFIHPVYTAYDAAQAREIIEKEQIDIVLCDIEMPMESGLDLLEWVRGKKYQMEFLFLTSHEKFAYAQRAISLGCKSYILKPVEFGILREILQEVQDKINKKRMEESYTRIGRKWEKNEEKLKELFWEEILEAAYELTDHNLVPLKEKYHMDTDLDRTYAPVVFSVKYRPVDFGINESSIIQFAFFNILREIFQDEEPAILHLSEERGVILTDAGSGYRAELIKEKCYLFVNRFRDYFGYQIAAYMGRPVSLKKVREQVQKFIHEDQNNGYAEGIVYENYRSGLREVRYIEPNKIRWQSLLEGYQFRELRREIDLYFAAYHKSHWIEKDILVLFSNNFDELLYQAFSDNRVLIQRISGEIETYIYQRRLHSMQNLLEYVDAVLEYISGELRKAGDINIIDKIKQYIEEHIEEEISREQIAGYVFLNPDYASRIFKKAEGIPLKEYILEKKVGIAKEMLAFTDMPVGEIGMRIGFSNPAHFATAFRKITGATPRQYREKSENENKEV